MPKQKIKIQFKKVNAAAKEPRKLREDDIGIDLFSIKKLRVNSNSIVKVPTGLAVAIPKGHYGQIEERSGFGTRNTLKLKAGVIDCNYRGELQVVFQNSGSYPVDIEAGDGIAQLLIHKLPSISIEMVDTLDETDRGEKGFGSSDKRAT